MELQQRQYVAIDQKSFYASVECVERGLDPLDVCLVVADRSRTDKTICLAVSPSLKAFGIGGRPRLFEVVRRAREVNRERGRCGRSVSGRWLALHPEYALDYIVAPPRMGLYLEYSERIQRIYQRYVAPEDIHVYSVDEVFMDVTSYLRTYRMTARELTARMVGDVIAETGITATAGIGTNLYLCKVAMDIMAKKSAPDKDGFRIAALDEMSYRRLLWNHTPLTDFWRVGSGTARTLRGYGIMTMGDLARFSLRHEDVLYRHFGVNAELLVDHAWGWEPATMRQIKSYRPASHSQCTGQVLPRPYRVDEARNVALEMADSAALKLVGKHLVTDSIVLGIGYDTHSLDNPSVREACGEHIRTDFYGRPVPEHSRGTATLPQPVSSARVIAESVGKLFDRIVKRDMLVRRLSVSLGNLQPEDAVGRRPRQLELFSDYDGQLRRIENERRSLENERRTQRAMIAIKKRFGRNAILKGLNFTEGATQRERNTQIGGHKA